MQCRSSFPSSLRFVLSKYNSTDDYINTHFYIFQNMIWHLNTHAWHFSVPSGLISPIGQAAKVEKVEKVCALDKQRLLDRSVPLSHKSNALTNAASVTVACLDVIRQTGTIIRFSFFRVANWRSIITGIGITRIPGLRIRGKEDSQYT